LPEPILGVPTASHGFAKVLQHSSGASGEAARVTGTARMLGQIVFGRRIEQNGTEVSVTDVTDMAAILAFNHIGLC